MWLLFNIFFHTYMFLTVFLNTFPSKYVICQIQCFRVDLISVSQKKLGERMSGMWVRLLLQIEWGKTQGPQVWQSVFIENKYVFITVFVLHDHVSFPMLLHLQQEGRTSKLIRRFSMVNVISCFWSLSFYILYDLIWDYSWTALVIFVSGYLSYAWSMSP